MLRADRELLARLARLNKVVAAIALPLCEGALRAHDLRALADELTALGQEFHDRAAHACATDGEWFEEEPALQPGEGAGS